MGIFNLIVILVSLFLVCCSHSPAAKNTTDDSRKYLEDAGKARKYGPLEGDVRVIDGLEYVCGKNAKYMLTPFEPLYVWVRRYLYTPSVIDTFPGRVGSPTNTKKLTELEERLARLERATRGEGAA